MIKITYTAIGISQVVKEKTFKIEKEYTNIDLSGLNIIRINNIVSNYNNGYCGPIKLDLFNNNIENIFNLKLNCLPELIDLDLSMNHLHDVVVLPTMENLISLNMSTNNITYVSGLLKHPNLKKIDLSTTELVELPDLKTMINLEYLDLHATNIKEINGLRKECNINTDFTEFSHNN